MSDIYGLLTYTYYAVPAIGALIAVALVWLVFRFVRSIFGRHFR